MLGLDQDADALAAAAVASPAFGDRVAHRARPLRPPGRACSGEHRGRRAVRRRCSTSACRSPQLDRADRGLQLPQRRPARHAHGPHRSRSRPTTWSTATTSTSWPRLIRRYGDERFAGRIARAIVAARPLDTTTELAEPWSPTPSRRRPAGTAAIRPSAPSRPSASRSTRELDVLPDAIDERHRRRSARAGASPCSPTTRARTASSRTASRGRDRRRATARPGCRAPAGRVRWCAGSVPRARRPMPTPRPTAAPGRPAARGREAGGAGVSCAAESRASERSLRPANHRGFGSLVTAACMDSRIGRCASERPADAADRRAAPPALRPAAAQAAGPLPRPPSSVDRARSRSRRRPAPTMCSRCVRRCASCRAGASPPTPRRSPSW